MANSLNKITTKSILDATVATADIAADAITGAKIADDAVGAEHIETLDASLNLADDAKIILGNNDDFSIYHSPNNNYIDADTGTLHIRHSTETGAKFIKNGACEFYHDNAKKLETTSNGISVSGGCTTTFGANTTNEAACIKVGYEGSSKGQVRVYGADASTTGSLEFKVCESDGTDDHTVLIDGSGNLKVDDGNLVIGTAGKGIDFSATSDTAGVDSENLDDYEEGSWTPTVYSSSAGTFTYASGGQQGIYTKVGNIVSVNGFIQATVGGTQTGYARLGSLPFTVANTAANYAQVLINDYGNFDNYDGHVGGYVYPGQTYAVLTFSKEGNSSAITTSQWSTSTYIYFSLTYRVA